MLSWERYEEIFQAVLTVENTFSDSLPSPESQFSDLSSMMPSLLDKGEPVDKGPTEQLHIYIVI